MKIIRLKMIDFCGLKDENTVTFPEAGILMGANGTGKTTVLNAIRYALTGNKPDGDIVNKDADETAVTLEIADDESEVMTITRKESRVKANSCFLNGKKVSAKALTEGVEAFTHLPVDRLKVISSAEMIASLSDADFGHFLLSYVKADEKLSTVKSWLTDKPEGTDELIDKYFKSRDTVSVSDIDSFEDYLRNERKFLKRDIASLENEMDALSRKLAALPSPVGTSDECLSTVKEDAETQLKALRDADADYKVYLSKLSAYNSSKKAVEEAETKEKALKDKINSYGSICEPDEKEKADIMEKFNELRDSYERNRTAWASQKAGKDALENEIKAISSPGVCPLSRHVKCHEDMTPVIAELKDAVAKMIPGMNALAIECNRIAELMRGYQDEAAHWQARKEDWDRLQSLKKELEAVKLRSAALPEKPAEVKKPDTAEEEKRLNGLLLFIDTTEQIKALQKQADDKTKELSSYDYLVSAVSDKGIVRENIVTKFLKVFEDECNKKCEGTPYEFRFKFEKGIVPEMKNSHETFLSVSELSGGEKAFFFYVIISLLNSLTGSRILLLDELSVMDHKVFKEFLDLIMSRKEDYDTVVLSCVDHPDSMEAADESGIEKIVIKKVSSGAGSPVPVISSEPSDDGDSDTGSDDEVILSSDEEEDDITFI
ncbi:MAG: AAA family ATPase [Candidatus Weimeria sp.]